jgi:hypothetical protein
MEAVQIYTKYQAQEEIEKGEVIYILDTYEGKIHILNTLSLQVCLEMNKEPKDRFFAWKINRKEDNNGNN